MLISTARYIPNHFRTYSDGVYQNSKGKSRKNCKLLDTKRYLVSNKLKSPLLQKSRREYSPILRMFFSGPGGIRTRDLVSAIDARSQLRYRPLSQSPMILPFAWGMSRSLHLLNYRLIFKDVFVNQRDNHIAYFRFFFVAP